jgi:hypothetical protein
VRLVSAVKLPLLLLLLSLPLPLLLLLEDMHTAASLAPPPNLDHNTQLSRHKPPTDLTRT